MRQAQQQRKLSPNADVGGATLVYLLRRCHAGIVRRSHAVHCGLRRQAATSRDVVHRVQVVPRWKSQARSEVGRPALQGVPQTRPHRLPGNRSQSFLPAFATTSLKCSTNCVRLGDSVELLGVRPGSCRMPAGPSTSARTRTNESRSSVRAALALHHHLTANIVPKTRLVWVVWHTNERLITGDFPEAFAGHLSPHQTLRAGRRRSAIAISWVKGNSLVRFLHRVVRGRIDPDQSSPASFSPATLRHRCAFRSGVEGSALGSVACTRHDGKRRHQWVEPL